MHVGTLVLETSQQLGQIVHRLVEVEELELGADAPEPAASFVVVPRARGARIELRRGCCRRW